MSCWRVCAFALAAVSVLAGSAGALDVDPGSGISIDISTPFDKIEPNGNAPVRIRIKNASRSDGKWSFIFQSPGNRFGSVRGQSVTSRFTAAVPAGSERELDCLVPLPTVAPGSSYSALSLNVIGPGVREGDHTFPPSSRGSGRNIGTIGFSDKLIGGLSSDLSAAMKAKGINESFAVVEISRLPPDWRALSAFDQIWMTTGEWDALPTGLRLAFDQWTQTGGVLYRCGSGVAEEVRKSGLGEMRVFPLNADGSFDVPKVIGKIDKHGPSFLGESLASYSNGWPDKTWIPPYSANAPLLILVIILFGIIVGPVNFLVFAGKEKRARIFWTTPLISVVGTVVICLTIFVQDGFGGWGKRLALIVIQPDRHTEVLIQEQASKTAVLPSAGFLFDSSAMIRQLAPNNRVLNCSVNGAGYGGDWFRSRSVQGQMITAVRPTRAEIRILNADEVAAGKPPRILSQIAGQLDCVFFQSGGGKVYRADDVGPGRETTMSPSNAGDATSALRNGFFNVAGARMRELTGFAKLENGWCYGLSKHAPNEMLPTLSQIRWTEDRALYLCPATMTP